MSNQMPRLRGINYMRAGLLLKEWGFEAVQKGRYKAMAYRLSDTLNISLAQSYRVLRTYRSLPVTP